MKIQITENDIKRMVYEGAKRAILMEVNIRDVVGDLPLPKVSRAFEAVFPDLVPEYKSNEGNFTAMLDTVCNAYDNAPEEQKAEFRAQLGVQSSEQPSGSDNPAGIPDAPIEIDSWESEGGNDDDNLYSSDEPIDFELDDNILKELRRTVDRVVTQRLNVGLTQDEITRLSLERANKEKQAQEICSNLGYNNFWRYGYLLCVELQSDDELSKISTSEVWQRAERLQNALRRSLGNDCRVDCETRGVTNGMSISSYAKLYIY